jgi:hypothetical protein
MRIASSASGERVQVVCERGRHRRLDLGVERGEPLAGVAVERVPVFHAST